MTDWESLKSERTRFDRVIIDWADAVDDHGSPPT